MSQGESDRGTPSHAPSLTWPSNPLPVLRNNKRLKGINIPGLKERLITTLVADDTNLYLSHEDRFDKVQAILKEWCDVSGAKFNIEKTEIIPIGTLEHREKVTLTRKINPLDQTPLSDQIHIASDGMAVRSLGAWIGNRTDNATPWEVILDKMRKALITWNKSHPTLMGRKIIVQAIVGGLTQFLTKAQGMPTHIETAIIKIIRNFMWKDDSSPRVPLEVLQSPRGKGGLNLLDIRARNEAIEIVWMKAYLNFTQKRPLWAHITDLTLDLAAPREMIKQARVNPYLQNWHIPSRGPRAALLSNDTSRMLKIAKKHNTNLAAIRIASPLLAKLPAWYQLASDFHPTENPTSMCLLTKHHVHIVAEFLQMSERIRAPPESYLI
jgi:hypothetical protein